MSKHNFSEFERAYVECMLWAETPLNAPEECDDTSLQDLGYTPNDLSEDSAQQVREECAVFQRWAGPWLDKAGDDEQNGHDFWLTRRRHGAGFWDRGYGDSVGEILTKIAQMFPEELCITVDGANHLVEIE